ncbi:MAG: hypothetical protein OHK0013_09210 [Sandaracinaceae bacterium]
MRLSHSNSQPLQLHRGGGNRCAALGCIAVLYVLGSDFTTTSAIADGAGSPPKKTALAGLDTGAAQAHACRMSRRARAQRSDARWWVGVDENGLGPRLGPLVATACAIESPLLDDAAAQRAGASLGIADSKVTSGFGSMAHAEGLSLAVAEACSGRAPSDADDVLAALVLDGVLALRAPCPVRSRAQCWGTLPVPAFGGRIDEGRAILAELAADGRGMSVVRVRSAILCARTYNEAVARLGSKLVVDLHLFERLLLDARRASGADVRATCGMVGGIRRYPERLTLIDPAKVEIVEETKARARYRVAEVGDVTFEVDADASALPVALASMVGKYLRELWMARQNAFYRGHDPQLPSVSGYHDPVTARLVASTGALRAELGIDPRCFERET